MELDLSLPKEEHDDFQYKDIRRSAWAFIEPLDLTNNFRDNQTKSYCRIPEETTQSKKKRTNNKQRTIKHVKPLPAPKCDHPEISTLPCLTSIPAKLRNEICFEFNNLNISDRTTFILHHCEKIPVQRRRIKESCRRLFTYHYFLVNSEGSRIQVCKSFFMATLGKKNNNCDRFIHYAFEKNDTTTGTLCARVESTNSGRKKTLPMQEIVDHINSYHPEEHHYRTNHAPKRLYLSSELTIRDMYTDFLEKNQVEAGNEISYESYRKIVRKLNISFVKLGSEECEVCDRFLLQHDPSISQFQYNEHKKKYTESRKHYELDAKEPQSVKDKIFFSVDMEKVFQIPFIPCYKSGIFCSGVTVFNETFVPCGKSRLPVFCCVWHEGISGRNGDDLVSTFHQFFLMYRDCPNIVLWCDNCSAQNKNWMLFTYLIFIINSSMIRTNSITLKFFEPGHSSMSADSFHHRVEENI